MRHELFGVSEWFNLNADCIKEMIQSHMLLEKVRNQGDELFECLIIRLHSFSIGLAQPKAAMSAGADSDFPDDDTF